MPLFCYTTFHKKHRGGEEDNEFFSMQKHFFHDNFIKKHFFKDSYNYQTNYHGSK
jgi:hypothetical protein